MGKGHGMMVPYPAQGHVLPLLEVAHMLMAHHIKITFVNTHFVHDIVANTLIGGPLIRFLSVPDGLEPEDRTVPAKFIETVWRVLPQNVEQLVNRINADDKEKEKVTCLFSDVHLCGIHVVARKLGLQSALFSVVPAAMFPLIFNIPTLIHDGIVDNEGMVLKEKAVKLAEGMPSMMPSHFIWHRDNKAIQKLIFKIMSHDIHHIKSADWVLCTSTFDLEEGAYTHAPPNIVPIGPLLSAAGNNQQKSGGHFLEQDSNCLLWLDHHPPCSVIYVAFGSTAVHSYAQFQQLAIGLEETNRPFLWVVRPDHSRPDHAEKQEFPEGFLDRVSTRGRITGWAPQQEVLRHPSVGCFVSHCGWNSAIESVSSGVPILCWPYFSDQFVSQTYICDVWKVGVGFEHDIDSGNIMPQEFKRKINLILGDNKFKETALQFKEKIENTVKEGGISNKNINNFITYLKE